jgi:hypothetical protein
MTRRKQFIRTASFWLGFAADALTVLITGMHIIRYVIAVWRK